MRTQELARRYGLDERQLTEDVRLREAQQAFQYAQLGQTGQLTREQMAQAQQQFLASQSQQMQQFRMQQALEQQRLQEQARQANLAAVGRQAAPNVRWLRAG